MKTVKEAVTDMDTTATNAIRNFSGTIITGITTIAAEANSKRKDTSEFL
jgi:hypothetical protein